jgi:hypothetical protein
MVTGVSQSASFICPLWPKAANALL